MLRPLKGPSSKNGSRKSFVLSKNVVEWPRNTERMEAATVIQA